VSARLKLAAVFLACAAPFVLGWAAWYFEWGTGNPGNYGELIAPRLVEEKPFPEVRGKWALVSFDAGACDAYCEKKLYYMRQVRTALGKEQGRVERLWLVTDRQAPRAQVVGSFEGLRIAPAPPTSSFPGDPADHIYLVDPVGNLMMRFPRDPDPSRMLKDLQRLLKYSKIG
jgi:cytochrome oxidase Cu insertion factor (SCO1/SenC/PrrC family)